ncbi:hypothetical protein HK102_004417 [Quaeritorhiza haematococci]|nr:hypothetical protein HK102_004417 [Quaeritorhiza haematococci]
MSYILIHHLRDFNVFPSRVQLKEDYIPGHGDTVDFVILGGSYNPDNTYLKINEPVNQLWLACLVNKEQVERDVRYIFSSDSWSPDARPHFKILFEVEAGLKRPELIDLNQRWKLTNDCVKFRDVRVLGAGFCKYGGERNRATDEYAVRNPRILRFRDGGGRTWRGAVSLAEFQEMAVRGMNGISSEDDDDEDDNMVEMLYSSNESNDTSKDPDIYAEIGASSTRAPPAPHLSRPASNHSTVAQRGSGSLNENRGVHYQPDPFRKGRGDVTSETGQLRVLNAECSNRIRSEAETRSTIVSGIPHVLEDDSDDDVVKIPIHLKTMDIKKVDPLPKWHGRRDQKRVYEEDSDSDVTVVEIWCKEERTKTRAKSGQQITTREGSDWRSGAEAAVEL